MLTKYECLFRFAQGSAIPSIFALPEENTGSAAPSAPSAPSAASPSASAPAVLDQNKLDKLLNGFQVIYQKLEAIETAANDHNKSLADTIEKVKGIETAVNQSSKNVGLIHAVLMMLVAKKKENQNNQEGENFDVVFDKNGDDGKEGDKESGK